MKKENVALALTIAGAFCAVAYAFGIKTPDSRFASLEETSVSTVDRVGKLEVHQAVTDEKIDALAVGLENYTRSTGHPTRFRHERPTQGNNH
jgi:hypothetical protein